MKDNGMAWEYTFCEKRGDWRGIDGMEKLGALFRQFK